VVGRFHLVSRIPSRCRLVTSRRPCAASLVSAALSWRTSAVPLSRLLRSTRAISLIQFIILIEETPQDRGLAHSISWVARAGSSWRERPRSGSTTRGFSWLCPRIAAGRPCQGRERVAQCKDLLEYVIAHEMAHLVETSRAARETFAGYIDGQGMELLQQSPCRRDACGVLQRPDKIGCIHWGRRQCIVCVPSLS
jgi:hypothetical protein